MIPSVRRLWLPLLLCTACTSEEKATPLNVLDSAPSTRASTVAVAETADAATRSLAPARAVEEPRTRLLRWMKERLPEGGEVVDEPPAPLRVRHAIGPKDSPQSLAKAYLDFTWVYMLDELTQTLAAHFPRAGGSIEIPELINEAPKAADEERLGWPQDKELRGIYLGGNYARETWVQSIDRLVARGMNAVVLDSKDYMGPVVYPSKIPLAIEMEATRHAPIRDLARTIRFAHRRGVRIILRISCFHDPWAQDHAPRLALKYKHNKKPAKYEWLDPMNEEVHQYIVDLAKEGVEAGADEIQLDYVRFPVQNGLGWVELPPHGVGRTEHIRDFVRKVHAVTKPRGVPLSLDIFGVTSTGTRQDIEALGQDIAVLAPECEALSPMVYPSHYNAGFHGFEEPGAHPEIIAIGTRAAMEQIEAQKQKDEATGLRRDYAVVRPWLQAFNWRSPGFGSKYIADEAKEAIRGGSTGWLLWDPGCMYFASWQAFPVKQLAK